MTLEEAKEILKEVITSVGLRNLDRYIEFDNGDSHVILDGNFSADDLEAIAVYMRSTQ